MFSWTCFRNFDVGSLVPQSTLFKALAVPRFFCSFHDWSSITPLFQHWTPLIDIRDADVTVLCFILACKLGCACPQGCNVCKMFCGFWFMFVCCWLFSLSAAEHACPLLVQTSWACPMPKNLLPLNLCLAWVMYACLAYTPCRTHLWHLHTCLTQKKMISLN